MEDFGDDCVALESIGHPSGYFITKGGKVISIKSGKPYVMSEHISKVGYPAVGLKHDGKTRAVHIHRLLALAFIPNPQGKPQVNHIDGDKTNNSINNLEWVTDSENKYHARKAGLIKTTRKMRRASSGNAMKMILSRRRFTDHQVVDIRSRIDIGESFRSIARDYQCDHSLISRIASGNSYARTSSEIFATEENK